MADVEALQKPDILGDEALVFHLVHGAAHRLMSWHQPIYQESIDGYMNIDAKVASETSVREEEHGRPDLADSGKDVAQIIGHLLEHPGFAAKVEKKMAHFRRAFQEEAVYGEEEGYV